ncbi:hypothetical protein F7P85_08385 [Kerstersia gyiorum]|uniref:hypothetical protein n=1 Tax=Kerstersia gyiorum TaxID=206506 RepID=UPI00102BB36C|nr:hypothetical protein [Kerstersia gyiorum]KAB0543188.1 hypothetical protein F7P85_08385 [Kerstersia gyiorum]
MFLGLPCKQPQYPTPRFLAAREADGPASRQLLPVMPARRRTDADGRWKDALDVYFQPCLQLFWPSLHALIDWRQPPQFLDKALQALTLSKGRNRRYVDKLASVQLLQGERICLLVHMEVQARLQAGFAGRMFEYFVRLRETYPDQPIVQLAIVTRGRPDQDRLAYCYEPLGKNFLSLNFSLPMLNLQGWRDRDAELAALAAHNPFALLVQAELAAARQGDPTCHTLPASKESLSAGAVWKGRPKACVTPCAACWNSALAVCRKQPGSACSKRARKTCSTA